MNTNKSLKPWRPLPPKMTYNTGVVQVHMELPPIPLIENKRKNKSENYFWTEIA